MSAGGAFGGARGVQSKAPEKGVFPLDHFGECVEVRVSEPLLNCAPEFQFWQPLTEACVPQLRRGLTDAICAVKAGVHGLPATQQGPR